MNLTGKLAIRFYYVPLRVGKSDGGGEGKQSIKLFTLTKRKKRRDKLYKFVYPFWILFKLCSSQLVVRGIRVQYCKRLYDHFRLNVLPCSH